MKFSGLYAITDPDLAPNLLEACEQALKGGVKLLQYRNKESDPTTRFKQARELLALCHQYGAKLLINDETTLAKAINADGVHLEFPDSDPTAARELLGADKIIGISCMGSIHKAQEAVAAGVDYVSFGCVFPSSTLPSLNTIDRAVFAQTKDLGVPLIAIGGITLDNAPQVIEAGADMLAVISGLLGQSDIEATARQFNALFEV